MGAKSKSGKIRGASRKLAARTPHRRRQPASQRDTGEQDARELDEFDFEIDCQRIVQREAGRGLPPYYDEYN